jgi:hypothetical protein
MTDLIERLRDFALSDDGAIDPTPLCREAADEIERLHNTIKNCPPVSESEYVKRLEKENESLANANRQITINHEIMLDAGREIERLQAEIAAWKKAADAETPEDMVLQMKADGARDDY